MNLQNLVDYCQEMELPSPFDGAVVPDPLNLETVISAIMLRCGLLTPVYNDPATFREATRLWFNTKQWTFSHLIKIIQAEYSPIENVDRYDEHTTSGSYSDAEGGNERIDSTGNVSHSGSDITTNEVSAFNSSGFQNDRKTEYEHGENIASTSGDTKTFGKTVNHSGSENYTQHSHGNIGVTSNQQLINQELELLKHFDIYKYIAEQFESDMMIMVY